MTKTQSTTVEIYFSSHDLNGTGFEIIANIDGGSSKKFQVDTGSNYVLIGKNDPAISKLDLSKYPCFGPGSVSYLPSGNKRSGTVYYLPLTLISAEGGDSPATVNTSAMVLVVDNPVDFEGGMMGVAAKVIYPCYNAFLNCSVNGTPLAAGYTLTPTSVILGTTQSAPPFANFSFVGLNQVTGTNLPPEPQQTNTPKVSVPLSPVWYPPMATLDVPMNNVLMLPLPISLAFELDTGIDAMLIAGSSTESQIPQDLLQPENSKGQQPFTRDIGTLLAVTLPTPSDEDSPPPVLSYGFWVGAPPSGASPSTNPPETPSDVIYLGLATGKGTDIPRVNVGIHPLKSNYYMYDSSTGAIGFAPIPNT